MIGSAVGMKLDEVGSMNRRGLCRTYVRKAKYFAVFWAGENPLFTFHLKANKSNSLEQIGTYIHTYIHTCK
jgi:hypothetical protein